MKLTDVSLFYQPFPWFGKNLNPPFFRKFRKSKPPLYKVGGFQLWSAQSAFRVAECPSTLCVPEFPSVLWVLLKKKKVRNIKRNGLVNSFIEFLITFQNTYFYITLFVSSFLGNKIYKFCHIRLATCNIQRSFKNFP